jgi:hypothetical protein
MDEKNVDNCFILNYWFKFYGLASFILEHTLHFIELWAIC